MLSITVHTYIHTYIHIYSSLVAMVTEWGGGWWNTKFIMMMGYCIYIFHIHVYGYCPSLCMWTNASCYYGIDLYMRRFYNRVFDKLIWCTIGPKSFLFVTSLGQMALLIMIILSLTALTLCYMAQGVFPMAHTLTIVEPIWPMLQNVSKLCSTI